MRRRIDGSLKVEIGPRTVGQVEIIYDGSGDPADASVDVQRPFGLKSPFSGITVGGVVQADPLPLDVSRATGIKSIIGDWDQDGTHTWMSNPLSRCTTDWVARMVAIPHGGSCVVNGLRTDRHAGQSA